MPADLLSDDLEREQDELEKDDMALLNEILNDDDNSVIIPRVFQCRLIC